MERLQRAVVKLQDMVQGLRAFVQPAVMIAPQLGPQHLVADTDVRGSTLGGVQSMAERCYCQMLSYPVIRGGRHRQSVEEDYSHGALSCSPVLVTEIGSCQLRTLSGLGSKFRKTPPETCVT